MNLLKQYPQFLEKFQASAQVDSIKESKQNAYAWLQAQNLPSRKQEEWKYTSTKAFNDYNFTSSAILPPGLSHETLKKFTSFLSDDFFNIVFTNGELNKTLTDSECQQYFSVLSSEIQTKTSYVDFFEGLNEAYSSHTIRLEIPEETKIEKPICIHFLSSIEDGPSIMNTYQLQVHIGARSKVSIVNQIFGLGGMRYFTNIASHIHVAESATLNYIFFQNEGNHSYNVSNTHFYLKNHTQVKHLAINIGAAWARMNLNFPMKGDGQHVESMGCYVLSDSQHLDQATCINHIKGGNQSFQTYKGILADESRAIFNGKVFIQQDAQKAYSEQLNNNLLLSSKAEINSKPQLEIFADDVKATHGSTVGQLNAEEIFYFQSRGISKEKALPMLSLGFVSELIYKIEDPKIENWLLDKLKLKFSQLKLDL